MVKSESEERRSQTERSQATRSALVSAGRDLFATKGYAGAGREAIVAAAGVTRGALQYHFGDKRGLFEAVYEEVEEELVATTASAALAVGHDRPLEMLRVGCQAYLDAVLDPAVQRICALDGPAVLPAHVRQAITDRYALGLVREALQGAVDNGDIALVPVEPLAQMLLAGVTAAAQYVATATSPSAARDEAGRSVDMLLMNLASSKRS
jgi:AcrR family transcriptional regulator